MRSRYEHDQNHPDSWPGENWLTDWWHGLTSRRRWAAGAGVVLAVVLALTGVAIAGVGRLRIGPERSCGRGRPRPAGIAEIRYRQDYINDPLVAPLLAEAGVKILQLR